MMGTIGLFYGTSTFNTEHVAELIAKDFGDDIVDLYNIADADPDKLTRYDLLIFGVSTWGAGELQEHWQTWIEHLTPQRLAGKKVALFGLGDQKAFPDKFVNALGTLAERVAIAGADVVGAWPTEGYEFNDSRAVLAGQFVGLVIDQDRQEQLTGQRVEQWVAQVRQAFDL